MDDELAAAHAQGAAAEADFRATFDDLVKLVSSGDALEVISRLSAELLTRPHERPEDVGVKMAHLYQVEQLQAFALTQQRGVSAPTPEAASAAAELALDLLDRNARANLRRPKLKYVKERLANERQDLLGLIQRWTLAVRGVRHPHQTIGYTGVIAGMVDASFRSFFGCDATDIVKVLGRVVGQYDINFQTWRSASRVWDGKKTGIGMIEAFVRNKSDTDAASIRSQLMPYRYDRPAVKAMLRRMSGSTLVDCFTLDAEQLRPYVHAQRWPAVLDVLLLLSVEFGELEDTTLEHIQLDNPIRTRPLIRLPGNRLFCGSPQTLVVGLAEIMEGLYARYPGLKQTAERARADWLEDRVEAVVRNSLPSADVYRSVKWHDGEEAETDLVAVIDQTVLVFEAKSAKILPPARRGALNSLKGSLSDLVVAPSQQSLRFKIALENAAEPIEFEAADNRVLRIDPKEVRDVIRVNILQDVVGPLSSHWPQLKRVGLIPADADLAPTMSIFDLESIFEVLSLEVERCHYLSRRSAIERHCSYTADELDLLSLYVDTQFNIGEDEFDGRHHQYYGLSLNITPQLARRIIDPDISIRLRRTEHWQRLLETLEEKKPSGWTRFGHRLLNVPVEGQREVARLIAEGFIQVERDPQQLYTTGVTVGTLRHPNTISIAIGAPIDETQFSQNVQYAAESAFEQGGAESLLLLYNFVPRTGAPYDFIGTFSRRHEVMSS